MAASISSDKKSRRRVSPATALLPVWWTYFFSVDWRPRQ